MSGCVSGTEVRRESDRRRAIALAIESATVGDVVVIAGKGHEATQTTGDLVIAFDDRVVAKELLR
jgi:UDP-N-acetylmuramoyl-L-alanyl-D-glutamate--2,6-diaminopimelate ligase